MKELYIYIFRSQFLSEQMLEDSLRVFQSQISQQRQPSHPVWVSNLQLSDKSPHCSLSNLRKGWFFSSSPVLAMILMLFSSGATYPCLLCYFLDGSPIYPSVYPVLQLWILPSLIMSMNFWGRWQLQKAEEDPVCGARTGQGDFFSTDLPYFWTKLTDKLLIRWCTPHIS